MQQRLPPLLNQYLTYPLNTLKSFGLDETDPASAWTADEEAPLEDAALEPAPAH